MPITVTNPVVIPATPERIYNVFWLSSLVVQAQNPNAPIRVNAVVEKVAAGPDNTFVTAPVGAALTKGSININDLYAFAATDADLVSLPSTLGGAGPAATLALSDIITALLLKMKALGEAQGKL